MSNRALPTDQLLAELLNGAAPDRARSNVRTLIERLSQANIEDWRQLALKLMRSGCIAGAVELMDAAMGKFPQDPELRYLRGNAHRISGQPAAAERDFREAIGRSPSHAGAALSLAFMLREQGRLNAAAEVILASWRAGGRNLSGTIEYLNFLRECGLHQRAHELVRQALEKWPNNVDLTTLASEFALAIGRFGEARGYLHRALEVPSGDEMNWLRLAYSQRFSGHDEVDFQRLEREWERRIRDPEAHACLGFAFGKALDDIGDHAGAAGVLRRANAAMAERKSWSHEGLQRFVQKQIEERELPRIKPSNDFIPVFVVGLPRTGTTLAASLLARNDLLRNRGELNWIDGMYQLLVAQGRLHDTQSIADLARLVVMQLRQDDAPARWYLDKNPLNFRYLNLIAAFFPNAKTIVCKRDDRDTALSLWMQRFAHSDLDFSYEFSRIAAFGNACKVLMQYWRSALTLDFFDLDYEALVMDTPATLNRLHQFLGMEAAETSSTGGHADAITTASVWQVRQPVYTSSIGRWARYEEYFPELQTLF